MARAGRDPKLRSSWGLAEGAVAAIHVGRIAAEKNLGLAVRSYRGLQQALRDGRHGAAVALGDERGFIDAATRIALDSRLRMAMGAAARQALACLHPQQVARDFDALLAGLVRQAR